MRFALSLPNFGAFADVREVTAVAAAAEDGGWDGEHLRVRTPGFLPTPLQQPRVPVWVPATWPGHPKPIARARRWDGLVPISADLDTPGFLTPDDIGQLVALVDREPPFDVVVTAAPLGDPRDFEAAGATWWMQVVFTPADAHARAIAGPPRG